MWPFVLLWHRCPLLKTVFSLSIIKWVLSRICGSQPKLWMSKISQHLILDQSGLEPIKIKRPFPGLWLQLPTQSSSIVFLKVNGGWIPWATIQRSTGFSRTKHIYVYKPTHEAEGKKVDLSLTNCGVNSAQCSLCQSGGEMAAFSKTK
jgi:hypothetical protein